MTDSIITDDFADLGTITSISETAPYVDDNVKIYGKLKRRFRADGVPKSDASYLLKFDFGAATSVVAVVLDDVNFDCTRIRAHATDLGVNWAGSTFDSGVDSVIGLDERNNRYKIYIPAVFNLRWMIVQVPVAAIAVGDYTTKWEVGRAVVLATTPNISKNAVARTSIKEFEEIELPYGGFERVALGDDLRVEIEISIEQRAEEDEAQYWAINQLDSAKPLVYFENSSDANEDNKVYVCVRDTDYVGTRVVDGLVAGNTIKLKELV